KVLFFFRTSGNTCVSTSFPIVGIYISTYGCFTYHILIRYFRLRGKKMRSQDVITERQREMRRADIQEQAQKRDRDHLESQKNQNFTQVYPLGWKRLMELAKGNTAAFGFYTYLAQHIDGSCGAVLADQEFFASEFGVTSRTIRNWVKYLEDMGALVKIPVTGRVCAYALNPHEVWKGYDNAKPYAAFLTKTLVNKDGDIQRRIMAMFKRQEAEGDAKDQQDIDLE
ncbi:TPA: hypothetical protein ACNHPS_005008, partial [Escherichia coli]